jgi:hypothetical protein
MSLLEYGKLTQYMVQELRFWNFGLVGCESTKKCAKSTKDFLNHIPDPLSFLYSESDIYAISTKKAKAIQVYQNVENALFLYIQSNSWLLGQKSENGIDGSRIDHSNLFFRNVPFKSV